MGNVESNNNHHIDENEYREFLKYKQSQQRPQQRPQQNSHHQQSHHQQINPYEIFGLDKNFDINELKQKFRKMVLKYHPDRGGHPFKFNIIQQCYNKLKNDFEMRQNNKTAYEMKNAHSEYAEQQRGVMNKELCRDNFNVDKFNNVFSKVRLGNAYDRGYGNQMEKSSKNRDDIEPPTRLQSGISNQRFNQAYQNNVQNCKQENLHIIKYQKPEALPSSKKINYSELGEREVNDFSKRTVGGGVEYTDYMRAHTTNRIVDPTMVNRTQFRSINELQSRRENADFTLTSQEASLYENEVLQKEEIEQQRRENVQYNDRLIAENFNKFNQLFLRR